MQYALLRRFSYSPTETEGMLWVPGVGKWHTIEPAWRDNRRYESCVPDGVYDLIPHDGGKYENTVALHNPELHVVAKSSQRERDYWRSECVIHAANFAHELSGCIASGMVRAPMRSAARGEWLPAVHRSQVSIDRYMPRLRSVPYKLIIRSSLGARI